MSGPPETSPGATPGQPTAPADSRFHPNGSAPSGDGYGTPGAAAGPYPAPPGGFGTPATYRLPAVRQKVWPPEKPEWVTAAVVVGALAVIGAALAPLWVHLAPRLAFRVDQPGRALPVVPEAEEYIGADGRFVFITLIVGVVAGIACWLVRRSRGPLVLLALAAAGLLGAVITWRLRAPDRHRLPAGRPAAGRQDHLPAAGAAGEVGARGRTDRRRDRVPAGRRLHRPQRPGAGTG